jgi:hypothetical protein
MSRTRNTPLFEINYYKISFKLGKTITLLQGNFVKNKEILNGWKEIMFFESGSTGHMAKLRNCHIMRVFHRKLWLVELERT